MNRGAELLLDCLKREEDALKISRLQLFEAAEWEAVLEVARSHGAGPVLYDRLKNNAAQFTLTADMLKNLRGSYHAASARNMRLYRQLLDIVAVFNRSGIKVILLKGAHLAEVVYGNIALRSMSDVDLLVKPDDLKKVHQLLVECGYGFAHSDALSNTKHLAPYRREKGVSLEIHFHITDPPYTDKVDIDQLWERAVEDTIEGVEVLTLSPEDLYLHLCLHSALQHGFEMGLVSCLDIAVFIERFSGGTDWEQLWNRGCEWGIERAVYLMAALAQRMLGVPMPTEIAVKLDGSDDAKILEVLKASEEMIFSRGAGTTRYLARLFGNQSLKVKLSYIKQRLFPDETAIYREEDCIDNRNLFQKCSYYRLRLQNLLKRHGKTVWHGLLGNREILAAMDAQNERNRIRDWMTGTDD